MAPFIETLSENPACLLDGSVDSAQVLQLVKSLIDPITKGNSVLDEIYVEGLDASQVWPQAKMILDSVTENLMFEKIPSLKDSLDLQRVEDISDSPSSDSEADGASGDEDDDEEQDLQSADDSDDFDTMDINGATVGDYVEEDEDEEDEEDEEDDQPEGEDNTKLPQIKKDKFGLNDEFFSIDDFNKETLAQEEGAQNDNDDDDEIDYFGELSDSEDEDVAYFDDFFDKPTDKKNTKSTQQPQKSRPKKEKKLKEGTLNEDDFDDGMKSAMMDLFADEDEQPQQQTKKDAEVKNLSSYERQQLDIQKEIAQLEKEAVAEKKWAMKGEAKAKDRPQDALLNEELDFERTAKPVPVITKEVTESLEEMIRRRIKEGNFDDLPRRVITDVTNFRSSSSFELSEQKSSKSLAEMYEEEYKGENEGEAAVSEELLKSHDEVKELFKLLSYKLDALSSAHFIPKPAQKAIDIKVNTASISMEDAQPLTQSSASTLAPQEIYKANNSSNANEIELKSGTVFARDELSREDKQRMRRANKRKRARDAYERDASKQKKSKKQDVIDTLSKAKNVTVIDNKGQRRDVAGNVKKDKVQQGTSALKL